MIRINGRNQNNKIGEAANALETPAARSRQLTPEIEGNVADNRQVELGLLEERQRIADQSVSLTTISAAALSIFAVFGVAIGAFLLERQSAMGELRAATSAKGGASMSDLT